MIPNLGEKSFFDINNQGLDNVDVNDNSQTECLGKRKISEDPLPAAKRRDFQSISSVLSPSNLLSLKAPYKDIESHKITLVTEKKGRDIHLYPTKKVLEIYNNFLHQQHSSHPTQQDSSRESSPSTIYSSSASASPSILSLNEFINNDPDAMQLNIEEDTTYYLEYEQMENKIISSIEDNSLVRSGKYAWKYNVEYMFIIDEKNNLLIQEKKRKAKHGRIHHSSLSQGKPVKAAGMIILLDKNNFIFENISGHYKPSRESLDEVITWFNQNGAVIEKIENKEEFNPLCKMTTRKLMIKLQENSLSP